MYFRRLLIHRYINPSIIVYVWNIPVQDNYVYYHIWGLRFVSIYLNEVFWFLLSDASFNHDMASCVTSRVRFIYIVSWKDCLKRLAKVLNYHRDIYPFIIGVSWITGSCDANMNSCVRRCLIVIVVSNILATFVTSFANTFDDFIRIRTVLILNDSRNNIANDNACVIRYIVLIYVVFY